MRITVLKLIEMLDPWVFCIDACLLRVFKVFCNFRLYSKILLKLSIFSSILEKSLSLWKISSMNEKIETVKRYNLTLSGSYKYYMNDLSFKNYLYAGLGYGTGQSCSKKKRYDNPMLS